MKIWSIEKMIITEKQIILLLDVLKNTLSASVELSGKFNISLEQRRKLYEMLINQQSDELKVME
jgi:hypothetical protein